MSKKSNGVLAIFSYMDQLIDAIKDLKSKGVEFEAFSPIPHHDIEHAMDEPRSPIRWITLFGALLGTTAGISMTTWMSMDWPMYTGGKDILSFPTFFVIAYETTILLGGLITLAGLIALCRLPNLNLGVYDPRFSADKFGIYIPCDDGEKEQWSSYLTEKGAEEVNDANA